MSYRPVGGWSHQPLAEEAEDSGADAAASVGLLRGWGGAAKPSLPSAGRGLALAACCAAAAACTLVAHACGLLSEAGAAEATSAAGFAGQRLLGEFAIMDVYSGLMNCDPFQFHCPLPLFKKSVLKGMDASEAKQACCHDYESMPLQWPYQFPECGPFNCSTCWRQSVGDLEHSVAGLAALGYATSLAVGLPKKIEASGRRLSEEAGHIDMMRHASSASQQILAEVHYGMRKHVSNMCPAIGDWEEYYLDDDLENTHARVYKSRSAKLAVIAFRGTELNSAKNWVTDTDIDMRRMPLRRNASQRAPGQRVPEAPEKGPASAGVHDGFYSAVVRILPAVRTWVEGSVEGSPGTYNVPVDWQLLFTGHSLGGAFATLAATAAEAEGWSRAPDAVITFGAPRVGDAGLSEWWQANGLCKKLMRVNVYNDAVHWLPSSGAPAMLMGGLLGCVQNVAQCFQKPGTVFGHPKGETDGEKSTAPDQWEHVCPENEVLVPGASKGVNPQMQDFSPLGGVLSHFLGNGLFGYGYGVLNGGIILQDLHCGLRPDVFPRFQCSAVEDLAGLTCAGLAADADAAGADGCRERCCSDPLCEVWQIMKDGACWRGRSDVCNVSTVGANPAILGQRVH